MDTECQRGGYDNTGRYHVPARGLWPSCADVSPEADISVCSEYGHSVNIGDSCSDGDSQTGNGETPAVDRVQDWVMETPSVDVPFRVQEFMFESLAEQALLQVEALLESHESTILEMARDRFRKGYARYGSKMYGWSAEERLRNVLEELADSIVYPTSGPIK